MRRVETDDDLFDALQQVASQLALTRQIFDEILDEMQWANWKLRDDDPSAGASCRTGMSTDSTAPDQVRRMNRVTAADVPNPTANTSVQTPATPSTDAKPGSLF